MSFEGCEVSYWDASNIGLSGSGAMVPTVPTTGLWQRGVTLAGGPMAGLSGKDATPCSASTAGLWDRGGTVAGGPILGL